MLGTITIRYVCSVAVIIAFLLLTACTNTSSIEFIESGARFTPTELDSHVSALDAPDLVGVDVDQAAVLRRESLTDLRAQGDEAAALADKLTEQSTKDTRAVPYYAESAFEDDRAVWIVLEMFGPEGGALDATRLWVLDRQTGSVVRSTSFR